MERVYIYRAPSGQWAGILLEEVARVGGCASADEALEALRELAPDAEPLPGVDDAVTDA